MQDDKPDPDIKPAPSPHFSELLGRALLDSDLCERMFADPEAIGRAFDLAPAEIEALKQLDRGKFDATIARLRWG